jgi:hypothetical protein
MRATAGRAAGRAIDCRRARPAVDDLAPAEWRAAIEREPGTLGKHLQFSVPHGRIGDVSEARRGAPLCRGCVQGE